MKSSNTPHERLRHQFGLHKENKHIKKVVTHSLAHPEAHHTKHSARITHHSSASSHNAAHHSKR
jgi:hypothetical protein